MRRSFRD